MHRIVMAVLMLPVGATLAIAQTPGTPSVIVPPASLDRGSVITPPAGAAVDPNTITPGGHGMGLSEADARKALGDAGYSAVMDLKQMPDGSWAGMARKDQSSATVSVDSKGKVTSK